DLDHGTILMKVRPLWSRADIGVPGAAQTKTLFRLGYITSAGSRLSAFYRYAPGEWVFRTEGTTSVDARLAHVPAPLVPLGVAVRWVGQAGELGLAPGTVSIFLDGTRGIDGRGAVMTFSSLEPTFMLGNDPAGNAFDGYVEAVEFRPRCWTDEEIKSWGM